MLPKDIQLANGKGVDAVWDVVSTQVLAVVERGEEKNASTSRVWAELQYVSFFAIVEKKQIVPRNKCFELSLSCIASST